MSSGWAHGRWVLLVFAGSFAAVAVFVPEQRVTYDGFIMAQVGVSLFEDGTPLVHPIDALGLNTPYSGYGIGTSVVMGALYRFGDVLGANPYRALMMTDALFYGATIAGIFVLLRRRGFPMNVVVASTALFPAGTPLLAYALSDFSEPGTALMVVLGMIALDAAEKGRPLGAIGVGAATGAAALMRSDSWLLIAAPMFVALWVLSGRRWRPVVLATYAVAPFAAVWMAYNAARFGSPMESGYEFQSFTHPFLSGLYGLTLSPGRGVLVYVPVLLAAAAVLRYERRSARVLGYLALTLLGLRLLFYARWWSWYGGESWGPRFMVPALPAFAPLVAAAIARWWKRPLLHAAAAGSVVMASIGFLVAIGELPRTYGQAPFDFAVIQNADVPQHERGRRLVEAWTTDDYVEATDDIMFDWSRFPARDRED